MMEAVWELLRGYWEIGYQWALNYLSRYQYLTQEEYYENLFTQYFSVGGFVLGLIFVGIIFWAAHEDQKVSDFIKIVVSVAVINSCSSVINLLHTTFGVGTANSLVVQTFCPAYNMISGFLVTLVVSSYYREHGVRALMFGLATYISPFFLRVVITDMPMWVIEENGGFVEILAIILLSSLVCPIISKMKHFFTGWIWFFAVFCLERLGALILPTALRLSEQEGGLARLWEAVPPLVLPRLGEFQIDLLIFGVVLVFAIMFEVLVLPSGKKGKQGQSSQSAAGTA